MILYTWNEARQRVEATSNGTVIGVWLAPGGSRDDLDATVYEIEPPASVVNAAAAYQRGELTSPMALAQSLAGLNAGPQGQPQGQGQTAGSAPGTGIGSGPTAGVGLEAARFNAYTDIFHTATSLEDARQKLELRQNQIAREATRLGVQVPGFSGLAQQQTPGAPSTGGLTTATPGGTTGGAGAPIGTPGPTAGVGLDTDMLDAWNRYGSEVGAAEVHRRERELDQQADWLTNFSKDRDLNMSNWDKLQAAKDRVEGLTAQRDDQFYEAPGNELRGERDNGHRMDWAGRARFNERGIAPAERAYQAALAAWSPHEFAASSIAAQRAQEAAQPGSLSATQLYYLQQAEEAEKKHRDEVAGKLGGFIPEPLPHLAAGGSFGGSFGAGATTPAAPVAPAAPTAAGYSGVAVGGGAAGRGFQSSQVGFGAYTRGRLGTGAYMGGSVNAAYNQGRAQMTPAIGQRTLGGRQAANGSVVWGYVPGSPIPEGVKPEDVSRDQEKNAAYLRDRNAAQLSVQGLIAEYDQQLAALDGEGQQVNQQRDQKLQLIEQSRQQLAVTLAQKATAYAQEQKAVEGDYMRTKLGLDASYQQRLAQLNTRRMGAIGQNPYYQPGVPTTPTPIRPAPPFPVAPAAAA